MSSTYYLCPPVWTQPSEEYERTIADLQGYLHEAIKAYEALEAQTHEAQTHRITKLEAAVESQKHVITQQNETLDLLYDERDRLDRCGVWAFRDTEPTARDTPSP